MPDPMEKLRSGYTTGACAAAAAKAAWLELKGASKPDIGQVEIIFPDGSRRDVEIRLTRRGRGTAVAEVRKFAGDDPDVTDGAVVSAEVSEASLDAIEADERDHVERCAGIVVVVAGGEGVGLSTRTGIKVPPGKWAVNPAPRRMIADNIAGSGVAPSAGKSARVVISVANGAEIAEKTLNAKLGVVGGVSILGTTGIVTPHSHSAYVETIRLLVENAVTNGAKSVCFCTGAATERAARQHFQEVQENAFIRIADFIGDALDAAEEGGVTRAVVACMPGKLFKYALGFKNTHAAKVEADVKSLSGFMRRAAVDCDENAAALDAPTIRGAMKTLSEADTFALLEELGLAAAERLSSWVPSVEVVVSCFDFDAKVPLGKWTKQWRDGK